MKKTADIQMTLTVEFDDDEERDLKDQAMEAADALLTNEGHSALAFAEIVGEVT